MLAWLTDFSHEFGLFNLFRYLTFRTLGAAATALFLVFFFGPNIIAALRLKQGKGQPIRTDGPASHLLTKKGTPTMGGLMILFGLLVSSLLWANLLSPYVWTVLFVTVGFGGIDGSDRDNVGLDREYKQLFSPEFRNRLDAKIQFSALDPAIMKSIVGKFTRELSAQLAERSVTIDFTSAAVDYLAAKGYDKDNGARPLARVIQDEVKRPLGDELLFGRLENGGHVTVDVAVEAGIAVEEVAIHRDPESQNVSASVSPSAHVRKEGARGEEKLVFRFGAPN